jgi:hypothetical protein
MPSLISAIYSTAAGVVASSVVSAGIFVPGFLPYTTYLEKDYD